MSSNPEVVTTNDPETLHHIIEYVKVIKLSEERFYFDDLLDPIERFFRAIEAEEKLHTLMENPDIKTKIRTETRRDIALFQIVWLAKMIIDSRSDEGLLARKNKIKTILQRKDLSTDIEKKIEDWITIIIKDTQESEIFNLWKKDPNAAVDKQEEEKDIQKTSERMKAYRELEDFAKKINSQALQPIILLELQRGAIGRAFDFTAQKFQQASQAAQRAYSRAKEMIAKPVNYIFGK